MFFFWKRKPKVPVAVIETAKGRIEFELFAEKAPITTANFTKLVQKKFYDGLTFHRVVPGFVIQGGCPKGDGTGGSGEHIQLEIHPDLKHDAQGIVAMARASGPNSASSQFYITLGAHLFLDGQYAVFGRVTSGMDVVNRISRGDRMESVRIL
jgi:cyclophilin family peptidyl-prolyl cis-trans isomerase